MIPRSPAQPDERQRYWRRRANRRVRASRLKRSAARGALLLAANAVVGGILIYAGTAVVTRVIDSPEFRVETVRVDGAVNCDADALRGALDMLRGQNLISLDLRAVEALVERDPWIATAAVRRILPDTLRVSVRERRPAVLATFDGETWVVGDDGGIIGRAGEAAGETLPLVTGLDGLDRAGIAGALSRGIAAIERVRAAAPGLAADLAELDLTAADRFVARPRGHGPDLYLDPHDVARNVAEYIALADVLRSRAGSMRYVDLRWDGRIAVMPKDDFKETR